MVYVTISLRHPGLLPFSGAETVMLQHLPCLRNGKYCSCSSGEWIGKTDVTPSSFSFQIVSWGQIIFRKFCWRVARIPRPDKLVKSGYLLEVIECCEGTYRQACCIALDKDVLATLMMKWPLSFEQELWMDNPLKVALPAPDDFQSIA